MKLALIAIFFSALQAAPPVPRQAVKGHSEKAETKTQIPKDGQQSTAALPSDIAVSPSIKEDSSAKSASNKAQDKDQTAKKYEPWTRADKLSLAYDILTGLLVVIGGFGVRFALRTLRAIEGQTHVLSEAQRPRIVAEAGEHPSKTLSEDPETPRVVLKIINKGPMPATGYVYESWIEVLPDTFGDFTANADHHKSEVVSVLYPDSPQKINIPMRGGISDQDWPLIRKLEKYVCIRLHVEYQDPFVPTRRCYADFGFHVLPSALGFLDKHNGVGYMDKKS